MSPSDEEHRLLYGILSDARVDDAKSIEHLLSLAGVTASDLIAADETRAEVMLQKAGLLVGDCGKIVQALRGFHSNGASPSRRGASSGLCRCLCSPCAAAYRCLCGVTTSVAHRNGVKPSIKCGMIMYSLTVLIITLATLSFYLPAVLYQVKANHRRIGSHFFQPTQANFLMPSARGGGGVMGGGRGPASGGHSVLMVTANQPLPCTTRRGDWIMEVRMRACSACLLFTCTPSDRCSASLLSSRSSRCATN